MAVHDRESSPAGTPAGAEAGSTVSAADRREHPRIQPDERNRLAATLSSGSQVRLIDLSRGGAQFECDRRFLPNASVTLRLVTSDGQVPVTGRVVRSRIVRLASGGLGYLVAVAFSNPLDTNLEGARGADERQPQGSLTATGVTGPGGDEPTGPTAAAPAAGPVQAAAVETAPAEAVPVEAPAPATAVPQATPVDSWADISAEEALAFEAAIGPATAELTVTASIDSTSEQLHDLFDGNDW